MKHFEVPSDYKKALLAVAVVGGVGIGAGLVARRIWQSKSCGGNAKKATGDKVSAASVSTEHGSGTPADAQPSLQPAKPVQPESLTTSGTFEKVPAPAADSFEQLTVSQSVPPLVEKTGTEVKPLQPVKTDFKTPSGGAMGSSGREAARITMKDKNDIVVVETESSGASGKSASSTPVKSDPPVQPSTQPAAAVASYQPAASTVAAPQSATIPTKSSTSTTVSPMPQQPSTTDPKV